MKSNQLKLGSVLSYLQMGLSILIGVAYTPVMLRLLGQSEYGLYSTVSSAISMLSILSLGFNSSYIRYYARYKGKNQEEAIHKLNGLFFTIFSVIGTVALLCGGYLSFHLELIFDAGLTASEYATARVLMLLLTINLAVTFPMSVFQNIISAHERFVFLKLLGMLKTVLGPLATLPLLLMGYRSVAMVCVTVVISLITDTAYFVYTKKVLRVKFQFGKYEKGIFQSLFAFTFFIALNLIVDQVNSNLGKFLLGRYKGTQAVAVYSVGYSLYQYYMMFSSAISGVFTPRIHKIVSATCENAARQKQELNGLFLKVGRLQYIILSLISTGILFFGKPFVSFWAGEGYEESYDVAVMLVFSSSIALIQNLGIEVQRAMNKHQFRSLAYFVMAAINTVLTIFFCQNFGAVGAAVGTSVSLVAVNGFVMNIYYHLRCGIDIIAFWKSIGRLSLGFIIPLLFGGVVTAIVDFSNLFVMLAGILAYSLVYCVSMFMFGMNSYEKELLMKPWRMLWKRR